MSTQILTLQHLCRYKNEEKVIENSLVYVLNSTVYKRNSVGTPFAIYVESFDYLSDCINYKSIAWQAEAITVL